MRWKLTSTKSACDQSCIENLTDGAQRMLCSRRLWLASFFFHSRPGANKFPYLGIDVGICWHLVCCGGIYGITNATTVVWSSDVTRREGSSCLMSLDFTKGFRLTRPHDDVWDHRLVEILTYLWKDQKWYVSFAW